MLDGFVRADLGFLVWVDGRGEAALFADGEGRRKESSVGDDGSREAQSGGLARQQQMPKNEG